MKTYSVGERSFKRIGDSVRWSEAQRGSTKRRGRRGPIIGTDFVVGIVKATGPAAEPDFTSHAYWFKRAYMSTANPSPLAIADYDTIDDPTDDLYLWASFTNVAEDLTRGHLLQVGQTVRLAVEVDRTDEETQRFVAFEAPIQPFVWGKITTPVQIATNRWTYSATEQEEVGDPAIGLPGFRDRLPTPRTFTGVVNGIEAYNVANPSIRGNSIDSHPSPSGSYPAGFALQPIRGNPVVQLWPRAIQFANGQIVTKWFCQYNNTDDGTCGT